MERELHEVVLEEKILEVLAEEEWEKNVRDWGERQKIEDKRVEKELGRRREAREKMKRMEEEKEPVGTWPWPRLGSTWTMRHRTRLQALL